MRSMSAQILSTKLSSPPLRARLVNRKGLLEKLDQGLDCGFVLISAPAGYGKSTLVSAWLHQSALPFAWLALDERDNDPVRFLTYLTATLQSVGISFEQNFEGPFQAEQSPAIENHLTQLINQFALTASPFWLVLDDYHVIQNQEVHQIVHFLLEHRPAPCHVVLITRADPPLPLAKLRARAQMVELRLADLRFRSGEATDFLNHTMGLKLALEDIERLTARTEGWIAGLQMAALALQTIVPQGFDLQEKSAPQNADEISNFITTLTGNHHYIFDYLLEEVLERQAPEIRRFLLYTSLFDQLTPSLCDALLGDEAGTLGNSSVFLLETLEHLNLFILPLDSTRHWYRYHALFADLLRGYLQRTLPEKIPALHLRASVWFEEQGLIPEAIHHALAADAWARVVRLISANVFALLEQKELNTVIRRLDALTGGDHPIEPWLWIGRAWLAAYTGQFGNLEALLSNAEIALDKENTDHQQSLRGHCLTIRAFAAWVGGKHTLAEQTAREALDILNEADLMICCLAATVLGLSLSNMSARARAFEQALVYSRQCNISHITFFAHGCWAYDLVIQGHLSEALAFCEASLVLAKSDKMHPPLPTLSYIHSTIALILWQRNDLNAALNHAREAVTQALQWGQADALHFAYTIQGDTLFAVGAMEDAFAVLQKAWQVACRTSKWFEEITLCQEVEWYVIQNKSESAVERLHIAQINIEDRINKRLSRLLDMAIAQVFLAQEKYERALAIIAVILERMAMREDKYHSVRVIAWQALAYFGLGDKKRAFASLECAFTQGEAEGHLRSFFVAGSAFTPLLHEARTAGIQPDFIDKLLASLYREDKVQVREAGIRSGLIEPLSRREIDVLKLLSQGYADKQIANSLVIARETVHKHLKNIYEKLGVHSRTEAIAHARELGIL